MHQCSVCSFWPGDPDPVEFSAVCKCFGFSNVKLHFYQIKDKFYGFQFFSSSTEILAKFRTKISPQSNWVWGQILRAWGDNLEIFEQSWNCCHKIFPAVSSCAGAQFRTRVPTEQLGSGNGFYVEIKLVRISLLHAGRPLPTILWSDTMSKVKLSWTRGHFHDGDGHSYDFVLHWSSKW